MLIFFCMKAIEIQSVQKTYSTKKGDVHALKNLDLAVEEGEFFGLLGPNGAGKSTLINILAGITQKNSGKAMVFGKDIDEDPSFVKNSVGIVPQELAFDSFFDVNKVLRYQFGYYNQKVDEAYLADLLDRLSLTDKLHSKLRELSGGMKRRVMIARALIHRPKVIVLDEPTAGVDVELRHDLYDLVRELNKQGTTIVLTSHYLEEVELLCERIAIINKGELVALDTKKALKDRFQSTRKFVIALAKSISTVPPQLAVFSPEINGMQLTLTFEESDYKRVLSAVANADLPMMNFRVIEPSLEDVFLQMTKTV